MFHNIIRSRKTTLFTALLTLVLLPIHQGCNVPTPIIPTLATEVLSPGEFITLSNPGIQAGTAVKVRFEGSSGFVVGFETMPTEDGKVAVAVPPFIDTNTGSIIAGEFQASLPGFVGDSVTVTMRPLPQLNEPAPGSLLREVLLESLKLADAAEAKAAEINSQFPGATATVQELEFFTQQRVALNDMLNELDTTQQLTVETADGTVITLTGQSLEMVDRLLASYLVGIIDQTGGNSSSLSKSAPRFQNQGEPIIDFESLQNDFRTMANNVVNGGGAFLGSTALIVAGSALVLSGAGEVAVIGGGVLAAGGAVWALGSTSILNNLGGFFDDKLGDLYVVGDMALEQVISVGTAAGSAFEGRFGQLFSGASGLLTAQSTYINFTSLECETTPPDSVPKTITTNLQQSSFCLVIFPDGGSMDMGVSDGEGCEVTGCGADEACCNGSCIPVGVPTASLCPESFVVSPFFVFSPDITVSLDRSELNQELFRLKCFYIDEDGSVTGEITLLYEPVGVNSAGDGSCGSPDDNGDNIIEQDFFSSTTRTISVLVNAGLPVVDQAALQRGILSEAVTAGIGSDCCLGG